jgi:DNA-binding CsgD family transcriptional regulator
MELSRTRGIAAASAERRCTRQDPEPRGGAADWAALLAALRAVLPFDAAAALRQTAGGAELLHAEGATTELRGFARTKAGAAAEPAHAIEIGLRADAGASWSLLLLRDPQAAPFAPEEVAAAERLAPLLALAAGWRALARAAEAAHRREASLRQATTAVLERCGLGVALVDAELRALQVVGRAARTPSLAIRGGRLAASDSEEDRRLRAAVAAVLHGARPQGLRLGTEDAPTRAVVTRCTEEMAAILLPCDAPPDHPEEVIQALFGLTRVEAAVTKLLADGVPPKRAAERLRMSHNTLRGYMKAIFAKLGVHRQSELVRVVSAQAGLVRCREPAARTPHPANDAEPEAPERPAPYSLRSIGAGLALNANAVPT